MARFTSPFLHLIRLSAPLCALAILLAGLSPGAQRVESGGATPLYKTVTLAFAADQDFRSAGVGGSNSTDPNPWTHRRLNVYFDHPTLSEPIRVPGYFAGNGAGSRNGRVWRAHFTPRISGEWIWFATFEKGHILNAAPPQIPGAAVPISPGSGEFEVGMLDRSAPGFESKGAVTWDPGGDYLRYSEGNAGRFVQAGVGSPENFLGYAGFTGAVDGGTGNGSICCCKQSCFDDCRQSVCQNAGDPAPNFLHTYEAHIEDWNDGDPDWGANGQPNQGRGIIGALNYLGDVGVNSMYFMLMNLGGDGKDTHPFMTNGGGTDCPIQGSNFSALHTLSYDVVRMDQWRTVFEHANRRGIMLQFLLAEQEACNIRWFGPHSVGGGPRNHMSVYRRLFMKQMVAQFGHLHAMRFTLCEENKSVGSCAAGDASCGTNAVNSTAQFTAAELDEMARWIRTWDDMDHPIGVHTVPNDTRLYGELLALPEFPEWLTATSLQVHGEGGTGNEYEGLTDIIEDLFAQAGHNIPVIVDEQGSPSKGLSSQFDSGAPSTSTADDRRRRILYDVLLSGGQLGYYFGYHTPSNGGGDLRTEDFRTRDTALRQMAFAHQVMETIKIWEMDDRDVLLAGEAASARYGRPEVAATPNGERIAVYYSSLKNGSSSDIRMGRVDLRQMTGFAYQAQWLNPREMREVGDSFQVIGGGFFDVPTPDIDGNGVAGDAITANTDLVLLLLSRGLNPTTTE